MVGCRLTAALRQDDGLPIFGRWLATALRPHYVSRRQYLVKMRSKGKEVHRQLLFRLLYQIGIDIWLKDIIYFGDEMTWISQLGFHIDSEILTMYCLRLKMANIY